MEISLIDLKRLKNYLYNEFGIYLEDDKLETIYKRKLEKVVKNFSDFKSFYRELAFNKNEKLKQELINIFTVNETYFFRENYQFDTLINFVIPNIIKKHNDIISILSAPVSSGEELYSIAIYLLEQGEYIQKRDFFLLGIDVDSNMIKKAKEGIYSQRSVQKLPNDILNKYFDKVGNLYKVKDFLRKAVNFKVVNVFDKYAMKKLGNFDVIFSRNMLIYFDEKSRREVIATFYSILKDEGYLFLGHAERIPNEIKLFKSLKLGESFVYQKNSNSE